jgi:hypothetical protein
MLKVKFNKYIYFLVKYFSRIWGLQDYKTFEEIIVRKYI